MSDSGDFFGDSSDSGDAGDPPLTSTPQLGLAGVLVGERHLIRRLVVVRRCEGGSRHIPRARSSLESRESQRESRKSRRESDGNHAGITRIKKRKSRANHETSFVIHQTILVISFGDSPDSGDSGDSPPPSA